MNIPVTAGRPGVGDGLASPRKHWLIVGGAMAGGLRESLDLTPSGAPRVYMRCQGVRTWRDGKDIRLLDGVMLDSGLAPVATRSRLDPTGDGHGNFAYLEVSAADGAVTCFADACESRNVFYRITHDLFVIGSDVATVAHADGNPRPDEASMFAFLRHGLNNVNERTFFKDVSKLKAGTRLDIRQADGHVQASTTRYYRPLLGDRVMAREDALDAMEDHLRGFMTATRAAEPQQMAYLNSSVDTQLPYLLAERMGLAGPSVTPSFDYDGYDDFARVSAIRDIGPDNHALTFHVDALSRLPAVIAKVGQPINGLASIATAGMYAFAGGHNADALISGVGYYLWAPISAAALQLISSRPEAAYTGSGDVLPPSDFLSEDFSAKMADRPVRYFDVQQNGASPLKRHILDTVFVKRTPHVAFDHAAAANAEGVEFLSPFMDRGALELCLSLADACLAGNAAEPHSMLPALYDKLGGAPLPDEYIMHAPQREIVRGPYRQAIYDLLDDSTLADDGYIDAVKLKSQYNAYLAQADLGNSFFIWKFIVTETWYRLFFKNRHTDLRPQQTDTP